MAEDQPDLISDARALRALAHPLRWRLVNLLSVEPTLTATRCAELTGESVASCSYHLNTLARYRFVEPADGGTGREKPWRLVSLEQSWPADGEGMDDEGAIAAQALSEVFLDHLFTQWKSWIRWRSREEQQWRDATQFMSTVVYVTADELSELTAELRAVVGRFHEQLRDRLQDPTRRPAGARPANVLTATSLARPPEVDGEQS